MQKNIRAVAFLLFLFAAAGCGGGTSRINPDFNPFAAASEANGGVEDAARTGGVLPEDKDYDLSPPPEEDEGGEETAVTSARPPFVGDAGDQLMTRIEAGDVVSAPSDGEQTGTFTVTTRPQLTSQDLADIFRNGGDPIAYGDHSQLSRQVPAASDDEGAGGDEDGQIQEFFYHYDRGSGYPDDYEFRADGQILSTAAPEGGVYELRLEYARLGVWNSAAPTVADHRGFQYFALADNLVPSPSTSATAADYEVVGDFVYHSRQGSTAPAVRFFPDGMLRADFRGQTITGDLTVGISGSADERAAAALKHFGADQVDIGGFHGFTNFDLKISFDGVIDVYAGSDQATLGGYGFGGDGGVTFQAPTGGLPNLFYDSDRGVSTISSGDFRGNFYDEEDTPSPSEIGGWVSAEGDNGVRIEGGFLGRQPEADD